MLRSDLGDENIAIFHLVEFMRTVNHARNSGYAAGARANPFDGIAYRLVRASG